MSKGNCVLCPWCGGALEKGKFHSRGINFFLPDGEKMPLWLSVSALLKKRAIPLPPDELALSFAVKYPVAYVCRACQRIVIPYSEQYWQSE